MRPRRLAIDVDDTLSITVRRWTKIMITSFPLPGHTIDGLISQFGRASSVPYWQHPEAQRLISELRVSEPVHLEYEAVEGAVDGVHAITQLLDIEYLTMRPRAVHGATERWLERLAFPSAEVIACPNEIPYELRPAWKAGYLAENQASIAGIVEDDDRVIYELPADYRGTIFLFGHHAAPNTSLNVVPCPTWNAVQREVKRNIERIRVIQLEV